MLNGIVYTDRDKCKSCSACLRVCQTKSIRIADGKAEIIQESCLNCGVCISHCSRGAKGYRAGLDNVLNLLRHRKTAIILAPSYVIVAVKKYHCTPGQFCAALRKAGFALVYEASFGADVVTKLYIDYIARLIEEKGRENTHVIASPCPSLMNFIEKHTPELIEEFAPIMSPMAAQAVLVKYWNKGDLAIVGANPCVAKKSELLDPELGLYEEDLSFEELIQFLDRQGIVPSSLQEAEFDGIQAYYGAGFPISGGLTKTLEQYTGASHFDPIGNEYIIMEGEERSTNFLKTMTRRKNGKGGLSGYPLLIDLLYCEGCILGKALGVEGDILENKKIISEYTKKRFQRTMENAKKYNGYSVLVKNTVEAPQFEEWLETLEQLIRDNKFTRVWRNRHYRKHVPSPEELKYILEMDEKYTPEDELNCGACGYLTCRDRAIAVHNGENTLGGCIIHMKHEAKLSSEDNKRLRELDQLKTNFLSTVSHELRTPLTSILGFAKIIRKKLAEVVFPLLDNGDKKVNRAVGQVRDNLDIIVSEGERLTNLINDVLDLAKMEAGRIEWKVEPLSIAEVIERAAAATTSLLEQKGLILKKEIPDNLPVVSGDRDRLIQTVINLISNAVKFTDEGSITCKASVEGGEIKVGVIDTGIGIAPEDHEKVFEKFKQIGDTLTDKPKGTGLGLPICKQIIEQQGGRIWVESRQGTGSAFFFALPLAGGAAQAAVKTINLETLVNELKEHSSMNSAPGSWKSILVVDDDLSIRNLLRQELEDAGYRVREAGNSMEALNAIRVERPDLIVLDVMMPGMNGFDAAAVLKNDPRTADIPVIILSVLEDRERGYRIGIDRYFTKPFNTEQLINEIGQLVSRGRSGKKILVVDEDNSTLKVLSDALESRGYTVVGVCEGKECINTVLAEQPDMIILDAMHTAQRHLVKTLRYEKGLENVAFIMLGEQEKKQ